MAVHYMHLAGKRAYLFYRNNEGFADKLLISSHGYPFSAIRHDIFYDSDLTTGVPKFLNRRLYFYSGFAHQTYATLDDITHGRGRREERMMKHVDYMLSKWQNSRKLFHFKNWRENDQGEDYGSIKRWMTRDENSNFDVITIRRRKSTIFKKFKMITLYEIMEAVNRLREAGGGTPYQEVHCSFCRGEKA